MEINELSDAALDLVAGGERICIEVTNVSVNGKKVADKAVVCYDAPSTPNAPASPGGAPILDAKKKK
jgi:hypothetical protein